MSNDSRAKNCEAIYGDLFQGLTPEESATTIKDVNTARDSLDTLASKTREILCGLIERAILPKDGGLHVIRRDAIYHLEVPESRFNEEIAILESWEFVSRDSSEGGFTLWCPGLDWDIFPELREFAEKKGFALRKLIVDLDFSLLDKDVIGKPSAPHGSVALAVTAGTTGETTSTGSASKSVPGRTTAASPPTCFISYSWDSDEHKDWVRRLATELTNNGVRTRLDQWDVRLGMDLPQYMETSIRESDFVLLVCTPKFALRANKGKGGVGYEKTIVTGEIYQGTDPCKFTPILRSGTAHDSLPSYLQSKAYEDFRDDARFQKALKHVLRHIFGEPEHPAPALGGKPSFKAIERDAAGEVVPTRLHHSDGPSDDPDDSGDTSQGKDDVY